MAPKRKVAIAVKTWGDEETLFVWNWAKKYFIRTGQDRDWLYIVHVNAPHQDRAKWKASGPFMPELDRALQAYSYDIQELEGDAVGPTLVKWVEQEAIDVLVVSAGRPKRSYNPLSLQTTDYIATHSPAATLVIQTKLASADITRIKQDASQADDVDTPISELRRVAYADETHDGIQTMMSWAAKHTARPDDVEFQVLLNRKSMLARVTSSIRTSVGRRTSQASVPDVVINGATLEVLAGLGQGGTPSAASGAPSLGTVAEDGTRSAELKGKPSAVIRSFVSENNIDLLVVPVVAAPVLRRMDKKRKDVKNMSSRFWVYQKVPCTCLCIPANLLLSVDGSSAMSSGLIFSEEEDNENESDENSSLVPGTPSAAAAGSGLLAPAQPVLAAAPAGTAAPGPVAPAAATAQPRGAQPAHSTDATPRESPPARPDADAAAREHQRSASSPPQVAYSSEATSAQGGPGAAAGSRAARTHLSSSFGAASPIAVATSLGSPMAEPMSGDEGQQERSFFSTLRRYGPGRGWKERSPAHLRKARTAGRESTSSLASASTRADVQNLVTSLGDLQGQLTGDSAMSHDARQRASETLERTKKALVQMGKEASIWKLRCEAIERRVAAGMAALSGESGVDAVPTPASFGD